MKWSKNAKEILKLFPNWDKKGVEWHFRLFSAVRKNGSDGNKYQFYIRGDKVCAKKIVL